MKTLHITVENKIATYHDRDGVIVCNNTDYMIEFAFDSEWDNHRNKTARFIWNGTYEDVVFTGNTVAVPVIRNALSVTVGVFSGDLKTTTPATIGCKKSILCEDGVPSDPGEDVYNQIIDLLNSSGGTGSGKDGVSPTVVVSQLTNGCLITITDVDGTKSAFIKNGVDGADGTDGTDGNDGVSPTISVKPINGGNRIEITDANGTNSFNIMDGADATVDTSELENKVSTLEKQMANLLYTAISITSFGLDIGTREYGETVSSVTIYWVVNKTPTTLTLDGETLDVSLRSKALTGLSITKDNNKTWKLVATDERGAKSEKTTTISFCNGIYSGAKAAPASYNSAFVLGMTRSLQNSKLTSVTVTAGDGEYIFYCLPKRMGTCTFNVGGFEGGFELVATIPFTNASGYTEDYYIYKSVNENLGKTTVSIS
jgi:hypothetical protein